MRTFALTTTLGAAAAFTPQQQPNPLAPRPPQAPQQQQAPGAMPAALTPQRRNPFKVVAGDLGHLATTVVKLGLRVPRATAGGVERLVGSINDARKRRAAAAYVDACLEEAPQPPPAQPVAVIKPPTQPLRGLSPVAMRAVKAGRANVPQRSPGLSASSLPVTPMDAAMGSRARASGVPATPVAYAPAVSGRAPSVLDAALGARQAIPINPSTRVSASSTAPSVLDAALGSRDRAAVVKPVTSVSKAPASRENYAEAALKQMQQRASAMDEVAARRRRHERDAAAAWTRQRERDGRRRSGPRRPTRGRGADGHRDRVAPPRRDPPLVDRRTVPRGGAFAPTQQYARRRPRRPSSTRAAGRRCRRGRSPRRSCAKPRSARTSSRSSAARSSSCSPSWRRRRSAGRWRASPPRSSATSSGRSRRSSGRRTDHLSPVA